MRNILTAASAALLLGVFGCGSNYSAPTDPSAPPPPAGAIVIDIVGINGAMSFSPNPATVPAGQMVVWRNRDSVTHRIVLDDGKFDAGTVAAGASTAAKPLNTPGPYHCTIHPEMVGRITGQ